MGLEARSVTVRAVAGGRSLFPGAINDLLCKAVSAISDDELQTLMGKHESDPANFDGRIEEIIRSMQPDMTVHANHRVFEGAKFNNDLVLETDDALVCLEIEKSPMARFEFDILKMQVFGSQWLDKRPGAKVYGAFIVPTDNVVARHISGNSRESSYKYLQRLSRLVAQINPLILEDVLIVGYSTSVIDEEAIQEHPAGVKKTSPKVKGKYSRNVVVSKTGLLATELLFGALKGYPQDLVGKLRKRLAAEFPNLREKINPRGRYLGYANRGSDAIYVYVRKKNLLIDIRLSADLAEDLRRLGFTVRPRDNFQAKVGWLTGLIVPHNTDKLAHVVELAIEALSGTSVTDEEAIQEHPAVVKKTSPKVKSKYSRNVVISKAGLLPEELLWDVLRTYPQKLVGELRKCLAVEFPGLREKINRRSRYLGYANGGSDAMYVYVRKKNLLIDIRLSADLAEDLRRIGFKVRPRDNYQAKSGWLTGLIVPHDTDKLADVAKLAIEALSEG
ncbi:MAG: hypothetical protein KAV87_19235 [Desulfobacteraceae bacterium]|nr:hypothetical protein [Desulfobacteraceae bacterium]